MAIDLAMKDAFRKMRAFSLRRVITLSPTKTPSTA
jgi:hypothetical protein